ncbi:hypothetical protein ACEPAF_509 [Sanghuangporus sanghuang]
MSKLLTYPLDEFHLPSGGIILKSSDGVEFKVYKNILTLGSTFFETMFSLPQPPDSYSGDSSKPIAEDHTNETQVIDVTESSAIVDQLLRCIYPTPSPSFRGISDDGEITKEEEFIKGIEPILGAALKYDVQTVVNKLCALMLDAAERTRPNGHLRHDTLAVRVYALACQFGLKEVAHRAAHIALKGRVAGIFIEDFRKISAAQYFALVTFQDKISKIMSKAVQDSCHSSHVKCNTCGGSEGSATSVARWWTSWIDHARSTIVESPASEEIYSASLLRHVYSRPYDCSVCKDVWRRFPLVSQPLKDKLKEAIAENDIDLSEI